MINSSFSQKIILTDGNNFNPEVNIIKGENIEMAKNKQNKQNEQINNHNKNSKNSKSPSMENQQSNRNNNNF